MGIKDWYVENFSGKSDESTVYNGMGRKARRNPAKRTAFVEAKRKIYKNSLEAEKTTFKLTLNDLARYYKAIVMEAVYNLPEEKLRSRDPLSEQIVFDRIFERLDSTDDVADKYWQAALKEIDKEPIVRELVPGLFDDHFQRAWQPVRAVKVQEYREAEAQRRKNEEEKAAAAKEAVARKARIEEGIRQFQAERAALMAQFMSETGFRRMQLTVLIEAVDNGIAQLRRQL